MRIRMRRNCGVRIVGVMVACGLVATGPGVASARTAAASTGATAYPLTVENCGHTLTFDKAPERVITYYQTTLEMLVALGLQDRIIGRAHFDESPLLPEQVDAFNAIPELSDSITAPPKEILLSQHPDFVFARYPPREFDAASGFATREEIEAEGIDVFVMSAQCDADTTGTLDAVFADIDTLGQIFDVQDRAAELSADLRSQLEEVEAAVADQPPVSVIWYDSGEGPLFVYGKALGSELVSRAGGRNVFGDSSELFPEVSVEAVGAAQPDVWITNNYQPGPTAGDKADFLVQTFPEAPASQDDRVVAIENVEASAGIRAVATVGKLAHAFFPDAFKD